MEKELSENKTAAVKLNILSSIAAEEKLPIYLFIDEYDNFANTILSRPGNGKELYIDLTHGDGQFRHFFNNIKSATTENDAGIKKMFITGVSPVSLDDVMSGFNIGENITTFSEFNSLVGFTLKKVQEMFDYYKFEGLINVDTEEYIEIMKQWYDNYCFSKDCLAEKVFNTDMVLIL